MKESSEQTNPELDLDSRRFSRTTFLALGVLYYFIASAVGNHLYLITIYGHERVKSENLHFVTTPPGTIPPRTRLVSNGDRISTADSGAAIAYMMGTFFVLLAGTFPLVWRLLPKQ